MKNAFYFILKALFVLKIFKFCPEVLVMQKKDLIRRLRLITKFVSQARKQIVAIRILPSISRNKGNHQKMKFGQVIEYNMRNSFFEKLCTNGLRENTPRFLSKKIKIYQISGLTAKRFIQFVFTICLRRWYQNILKLRC